MFSQPFVEPSPQTLAINGMKPSFFTLHLAEIASLHDKRTGDCYQFFREASPQSGIMSHNCYSH